MDWIVYTVELPVNTIIGVYLRTKLQRKTNFPFYLFIYLERDTKVYRCIYQVSRLLNDVHIMITLHRIWFQKVFLLARYFFLFYLKKSWTDFKTFYIYIYTFILYSLLMFLEDIIFISAENSNLALERHLSFIYLKNKVEYNIDI